MAENHIADLSATINLILLICQPGEEITYEEIFQSDLLKKTDIDEIKRYQTFINRNLEIQKVATVIANGAAICLTEEGVNKRNEIIIEFKKTLYEERDKQPIVEFIKNYINLNGYVNTRYATGMTIKDKKFQNDDHRDAFYESISAMLINTGKYTREKNDDKDKGYNILLNPAYFYNEVTKRGNKTTRYIAMIAALISFLTFLTGLVKSCKPEVPVQQVINIHLQKQTTDTTIRNSFLKSVDSSNHKKQRSGL